ncbi:MAG: hypothetical protein OXJ64_17420 [Boseongicola sp.]|nr:hypothetical protein [Boseongicola sp.]
MTTSVAKVRASAPIPHSAIPVRATLWVGRVPTIRMTPAIPPISPATPSGRGIPFEINKPPNATSRGREEEM